jgi:hypothetical protein
MPIVTVLTQVYAILNGLSLPGTGGSTLEAHIDQPDPQTDQVNPQAYIWPPTGHEFRQSVPRPQQGTPGTGSVQAGEKQMSHMVEVTLFWFHDPGDTPDIAFPTILDAVMDALRCTTDPVLVQDPVTFRYSQLFGIGEKMSYDCAYPEATTADQRTLLYRAKVMATVSEEYQA